MLTEPQVGLQQSSTTRIGQGRLGTRVALQGAVAHLTVRIRAGSLKAAANTLKTGMAVGRYTVLLQRRHALHLQKQTAKTLTIGAATMTNHTKVHAEQAQHTEAHGKSESQHSALEVA